MAGYDYQKAFIRTHLPYAERIAKRLNIHPFMVLGQFAQETNWGKSVLKGTNNFGNIMEVRKGVNGKIANDNGNIRKFRYFDSIGDFYDHYAGLIERRYKNVIGAKNALEFGKALKAGGYAEDPNYARGMVNMFNAVSKVVGNGYMWNGQPTTAMPVAQPTAGRDTMGALAGSPVPESATNNLVNPVAGQQPTILGQPIDTTPRFEVKTLGLDTLNNLFAAQDKNNRF